LSHSATAGNPAAAGHPVPRTIPGRRKKWRRPHRIGNAMQLAELVETSRQVSATSRRSEKIAALAACLRRLRPEEIDVGVAYLSGEVRQRKLGVGPATIMQARGVSAAAAPTLTLAEVDAVLERVTSTSGSGSAAERHTLLGALLSRATPPEQEFMVRLLIGELRQGALEGVMLEAVAQAAALPAPEVRRAAMLAGRLTEVARAALTEGAAGLRRFSLTLFQPVLPMLAQPAADIGEALEQLGEAALEWKLDGARVQVHKSGTDVHVFTRNLNDVTPAVPELVEAVGALRAQSLVLDGEAIALRGDGAPQPFQVTMRRFGRKLDVEAARREQPLSAFFFDCLHRDGRDLIDRPARERFAALNASLPGALLVPRVVTADPAAAEAFLTAALARGHEGVMAKSLSATYEAGGRRGAWLKIKQAHTLDLVVLAAEWGHGRRKGWLSNLHLGARDPADGRFVMLGKTFKGLTDEMLAWQTRRLLELKAAGDSYTVYVRPELVVEIAVSEIQASPHYPGGMALRFARVKRYRPDKRPEEADSIETVRALFRKGVTGKA
jgi:DNA ligase-1